jgi:hypothetical protein
LTPHPLIIITHTPNQRAKNFCSSQTISITTNTSLIKGVALAFKFIIASFRTATVRLRLRLPLTSLLGMRRTAAPALLGRAFRSALLGQPGSSSYLQCISAAASTTATPAGGSSSSSSSAPSGGKLYTQGHGTFGSLGTGFLSDQDDFVHVKLPDDVPVKMTSAGYGHSGVVSTCGKLYLMGIPVEFKRVIRMSSIRDTSKHFGEFEMHFDFTLYPSQLAYYHE